MWIVKVNNYEIILPQGDNVFLCSVQNNAEMKSTDFDYYYDDNFLIALGIKGVLEEVDGIRYVLHDYDGLLYNPLVTNDTFDCTLTINNISLTKKRVNMTVTANTSALSERYNKLYYQYRHTRSHNVTDIPIWGVHCTNNTPDPVVWNGYHIVGQSNRVGTDTKIYSCVLPSIDSVDYMSRLSDFGYSFINRPVSDEPIIAANTIYLDGDIKMRRGSVRMKTFAYREDGASYSKATNDICFCCKGDYAGVYNDVVSASYHKLFTGNVPDDGGDYTFKTRIEWQNESTCRKTRIYFKFWGNTNGSDLYFSCSQKCSVQIRLRNGITYTLPLFWSNVDNAYTGNPSTAGFEDWNNYDMKDSYVEFIPNNSPFAQDTKFVTQFVFYQSNSSLTDDLFFDFQQHWDDDYEGFKKLVSEAGDTYASGRGYVKNPGELPYFDIGMTTKHFDSRAWGCNHISDYKGHIVTGFTVDSGYHEPYFNAPSNQCPLMYVDRNLCLDATVYDIIFNYAYMMGVEWNVNINTKEIVFGDTISPKVLPDYIVDEEITFDEIGQYYWENASGRKIIVVEAEEESDKPYFFSEEIETQTQTCVTDFDSGGDYLDLALRNVRVPLKFDEEGGYQIDKSVTILHSAKQLVSGNTTTNTPHAFMARKMFVMQVKGNGYFMVTPTTGIWYTEAEGIQEGLTTPITTIAHPPSMKIKIPELLDTFYVTIQNRTFWVKSQEVGDDGVNEVELLLYC